MICNSTMLLLLPWLVLLQITSSYGKNINCVTPICDMLTHTVSNLLQSPFRAETCEPDFYNKCTKNEQCCSSYCYKKEPTWEFGVCQQNEKCEPDFFNKCTENEQCCSSYCYKKEPTWEFGVCQPNEKCEPDFFNKCTKNEQCCSTYCYKKEPTWEFGVCQQLSTNVSECLQDGSNNCKENTQCCSNVCSKGPEMEYGICKVKSTNVTSDCVELHHLNCDLGCCENAICYKGPYKNWKEGVCMTKTEIEVTKPTKEVNEDEKLEDDLNFVREHLFDKHKLALESNQLKCRELDPLGLIFFQVNETHSYRICDACMELPFKKLINVKVSTMPINQTSQIPFEECFDECYSNHRCVSLSFNREQKICQMFDSIEGEYDINEQWDTVTITQPVDVMRDYIYSRHTQISCESKNPLSYKVNSILECFSYCEKHQCWLSVYHDNSCEIFQNNDNCSEVYYKYGYVSIFYLDYIITDPAWRFIEVSDNEKSEDRTEQRHDNSDKMENLDDSRVNPKISMETMEQIKSKESKNYLSTCFTKCIETDLCTGVLFDLNQTICEIIDWNLRKTNKYKLNRNEYTEYSLIHPLRNQSNYEYNVYVSTIDFEFIEYNVRTETSLSNCLKQCTSSGTNGDCEEVYYNLKANTCLMVGEYRRINKEKLKSENSSDWINFWKSRPSFTKSKFGFALILKGQYLGNSTDKYLIHSEFIANDPSKNISPTEICLKKCQSLSDNQDDKTCYLAQVHKTDLKTECKLYKDMEKDETLYFKPNQRSDVYVRIFNSTFSLTDLNKMSLLTEEDALDCKPDAMSILTDYYYLYSPESSNRSSNMVSKSRIKRNLLERAWNFGKSLFSTGVKTAQTAWSGVKAVGKLVVGDKDGAIEEVKNAPLVVEAKDLFDNVKKVGEGIGEGSWGKIGEGILGVASNDLLSFVPGGKIAQGAAKFGKLGVKGLKKVSEPLKRGKGKGKKEIADINKRKSKDKNKKDKEKEKQACQKEGNNRTKRAPNKQNKQCAKSCPEMKIAIQNSLKKCKKTGSGKTCSILCSPGYKEVPNSLNCLNNGKWDSKPKCELETCGTGRNRLILFTSPKGKTTQYVHYAVLFDTNENRKLAIWSIAYHRRLLDTVSRRRSYYKHPCLLRDAQLSSVGWPGYDRGHLTPANVLLLNAKSSKAANSIINIAPQSRRLNRGVWKSIELTVQCASNTRIKAVVATGLSGDSGTLLQGVQVPRYFWKMVCYNFEGATHVVLFIGSNSLVINENDEREAATPRNQNYIRLTQNPWLKGQKAILAKEKFIQYPSPVQCNMAKTLAEDQQEYWRQNFPNYLTDIRNRAATNNTGPCCNAQELKDFSSWLSSIGSEDDKDDSDTDVDDIDNEDGDTIDSKDIPALSVGKKIVGYYPSWGDSKVSLSALSRFTHVIFAFFEMKSNGEVILGNPDHSSSQTSDEVQKVAQRKLNRLLTMKNKIPHLKVTFAVGGWENSQYFSKIAANHDLRNVFMASVLKCIDEYDFDGIDIDWEYPVTGGANDGLIEDKENYVTLMSELRYLLDAKAQESGKDKYIITFASAAGETALNIGYDLPNLLKYADWVNVMTYDYFGPWTSKWGSYTGPPAPLYHHVPKGYSGKFNVNWSIKQYVCKLKSPEQVVMGIPLYGRYWHNVPERSDEYAMYRLANSVNGKFEGGFVSWKDIKSNWLTDPAFTNHFDDIAKSPYAYNVNGTYLGYESPESVKSKIEFAIEKNLGGLMVWAIDQDDSELSMINLISAANFGSSSKDINFKCVPIDEKRWWTLEDSETLGGLCGRSAPLYRGYYPVCDPDDLGYSCCGFYGYCGSGPDFCDCPTCVDYAENPNKILEPPIKPSTDVVTWHFSNAPEGQRGRCGREVPKVGDNYATCNPDDQNAYCCSSGGYCGNKDANCKCHGCVNFKENPHYLYPPKTWWDKGDGEELGGKCGSTAPKLPNGNDPECNPGSEFYCCSKYGSCGSGPEYCDCTECINFRNS